MECSCSPHANRQLRDSNRVGLCAVRGKLFPESIEIVAESQNTGTIGGPCVARHFKITNAMRLTEAARGDGNVTVPAWPPTLDRTPLDPVSRPTDKHPACISAYLLPA